MISTSVFSSKLFFKALLLCLCVLVSLSSTQTFAADDDHVFDVDSAETTDFEDFHKTNPDQPSLKDYIFGSDKPVQSAQANPNMLPGIAPDKLLIASSLLNTKNASKSIDGLYQAMLKNCPDGFIKRREWTQKDVSQGAMIIQFEYTCQ